MRDWLDAIPNLGVPGVLGVQRQESATFEGTPDPSDGVPGVPEHLGGTPGTPAGTPTPFGTSLKDNEEHREHLEHRDLPEVSVSRTLLTWQNGLNSLDPLRPLHGLDGRRWHNLYDDAMWLAVNFAQQAAREGWSAQDLWGVLPGHDTWGGIADRLRGSRRLLFTGERAAWRDLITGKPDGYVRRQGDKPPLTQLWERGA